ncbi:hypothetical protein LTR03_011410 [Friedmanniomyces endolithicus]|nr:hypothetical protein LTR03_011410 [Friedmanniomyces endolithicus]
MTHVSTAKQLTAWGHTLGVVPTRRSKDMREPTAISLIKSNFMNGSLSHQLFNERPVCSQLKMGCLYQTRDTFGDRWHATGGLRAWTTHGLPPTQDPVKSHDSSDKAEDDAGVFRDVEHHRKVPKDRSDGAPTQDANAVIYNAANNLFPNSEFGENMYYCGC